MINRSRLIAVVKDEQKMLRILVGISHTNGEIKYEGLPRLRAQYQSWIYKQGATVFDVSIALASYLDANVVTEDTKVHVKVTYLKPDDTQGTETLEVSHPHEAESHVSITKGVKILKVEQL